MYHIQMPHSYRRGLYNTHTPHYHEACESSFDNKLVISVCISSMNIFLLLLSEHLDEATILWRRESMTLSLSCLLFPVWP